MFDPHEIKAGAIPMRMCITQLDESTRGAIPPSPPTELGAMPVSPPVDMPQAVTQPEPTPDKKEQ
jgi:hypothetical protein